jgi:predicted DNA-binding transcriptional regulator YafY
VRRDIDRLRRLGYPIDAAPGAAGGYRLGAGAALPPLLLDDDEAVAVAIGLRTAAGGSVAGIEETSVRALAKLEQVLPARLRRRVAALSAHTDRFTTVGPTVDAQRLATIAAACRDHEALHFGYRRHDGTTGRRTVQPGGLVHTGRRWYLVGWDPDRDDWRTFRVDRMDGRLTTGARFAARRPPRGGYAAHVSDAIVQTRSRWPATVILHVPLSTAQAAIAQEHGTLEAVDGGRTRWRTGGDWLGGLAIYIAQTGFDFEVVDPPELREEIRVLAARFARALS